jgi:hypothetical protein
MKKTLLTLVTLAATYVVHAQMIDASKVPPTVKATFEKQYPGITAQWEYEEGKFDAEFKKDGKKFEVLYDRQGNSAQKIDIADAPAAIPGTLKKQFGDAKLKKFKKLVSAAGQVSYMAMISDKTVMFDATGNLLETK